MRSSSISRLRLPFLRAGLGLSLAVAAVAAGAADKPAPGPAFDGDEIVLDRPQSEWSQAYLQWVAAFPRGSSPVSDATGAQCAAKQDGDVWFLAGSDGTVPFERSCSVPVGKTLFVPIANVLERSGNREPDCESMARVAANDLSHASDLALSVDGKPVDGLRDHRQASGGCFALGLRQLPRLEAKTAVADGYYVMLRPLAAGPHTIVVGARFDSTALATTYRLDVH